MKEIFVSFFVYFLYTLSVTYFQGFLLAKMLLSSQMKCLGQTPAILKKFRLTGEALQY